MPATMFTIGYQGATLADLIESLASADVSVVVDTRDSPHSRRPEFRPRSPANPTTSRAQRALNHQMLRIPPHSDPAPRKLRRGYIA